MLLQLRCHFCWGLFEAARRPAASISPLAGLEGTTLLRLELSSRPALLLQGSSHRGRSGQARPRVRAGAQDG